MTRLHLLTTAVLTLAVATACTDMTSNSTPSRPEFASGSGNPHFIRNATDAARSGNNLVVSFKETGLASGQTETVQIGANATANYQCINNGGRNPSAANKRTINAAVSTSGQFTADQSGNIQGSLSVSPPSAGDFTCPSGQTLTLVSVSYSNVVVQDLTSGAQLSISGTF